MTGYGFIIPGHLDRGFFVDKEILNGQSYLSFTSKVTSELAIYWDSLTSINSFYPL
jgi:hypothetical protein